MALIRYPGSKAKLARQIRRFFPLDNFGPLFHCGGWDYREPFFGAGAVGFDVMRHMLPRIGSRVWINDIDVGMVALWRSVKEHPCELTKRIVAFQPTTKAFYQFKEEDGASTGDPIEDGFRKLALHRMSYSGLGAMSGGPLGGREQKSHYSPECRWRPGKMRLEIATLHRYMAAFDDFKITNLDFERVMCDATNRTFIYADPPYYAKGSQLYKYPMNEADHERLAKVLKDSPAAWVLSYDDHAYIRSLYGWARIESVNITYTTARTRGPERPKNSEIVIVP